MAIYILCVLLVGKGNAINYRQFVTYCINLRLLQRIKVKRKQDKCNNIDDLFQTPKKL